jgi:hypothetical protein
MDRFSKHWRKTGFLAYLVPRADRFVTLSRGLVAKAMASMKQSVMSRPAPPLTGRRHGLRKLSPDLISKASDETASQVTRILLTFVGTATFCLLSLSLSDRALLTGKVDSITVPFAGPVSFSGFLVLGPIVLIVLPIFLQIYVEHSVRLDRIAGHMPVVRAPTLLPLQNPLIRFFSGIAFWLLLPLTMILFAWQGAIAGLLPVPVCLAAGVIIAHGMLPLRKVSWRSRALFSMGAAIFAGVVLLLFGPTIRRPFFLDCANLSAEVLTGRDLANAHLSFSNLSGADLSWKAICTISRAECIPLPAT